MRITPNWGTRKVHILNNTFVGASPHAIELLADVPTDSIWIQNNVISGGTDDDSMGCALFFREPAMHPPAAGYLQIDHNCYWHNDRLMAGYEYWEWPDLGTRVGTNAHGDSVDAFANIFLDPQFADTLTYALAGGSPCIDAGVDVGQPYRGAAPDIGWWEDEFSGVSVRRNSVLLESGMALYPNPTNGAVMLQLHGWERGAVMIRIYNVLGQRIAERVALPTGGRFPLTLGGADFPSGTYYLEAENNARRWRQSLIVMK